MLLGKGEVLEIPLRKLREVHRSIAIQVHLKIGSFVTNQISRIIPKYVLTNIRNELYNTLQTAHINRPCRTSCQKRSMRFGGRSDLLAQCRSVYIIDSNSLYSIRPDLSVSKWSNCSLTLSSSMQEQSCFLASSRVKASALSFAGSFSCLQEPRCQETVVYKATIRTPLAKSYVHLRKPNAWNKSLLVMHEDEDVVPIPGQEPLGAHWSICCLSSLQVVVLPEILSATETPERITKCSKAHRELP